MNPPVKSSIDTTASKQTDPPRGWLNRTVAGTGITSALGDFCYETTTVILPGFLAVLGLPVARLLTASMGVVQAARVAGLLYVWRNGVQVAVSFPIGSLADRLGHVPILVAGNPFGFQNTFNKCPQRLIIIKGNPDAAVPGNLTYPAAVSHCIADMNKRSPGNIQPVGHLKQEPGNFLFGNDIIGAPCTGVPTGARGLMVDKLPFG